MAKKRKTELDIDVVDEEMAPPPKAEEAPPPSPKEGAAAEEGEKKEKKPFIHPSVLKLGLIILPILLVLGGIGFGVSSYLKKQARLAEEERLKQEELKKQEERLAQIPQILTYEMSRFFVPLKDKEEEKFLSLVISMELSSDKVSVELDKFLPSIREAMFFYLSEKSSANLSGQANMELLEKDLKLLVNRNLQSGSVKKVLFLEYIIQ
ncbi:MAG: flagellar basal body-associated FliL family protein [Nitrospinae bacterium]|nr:flagellar basal body-associated FliL family protein [Nitrospinota bacterium]